jgi:hypothetical protein
VRVVVLLKYVSVKHPANIDEVDTVPAAYEVPLVVIP